MVSITNYEGVIFLRDKIFHLGPSTHTYLENYEERETGGTPDILGAIRCGLAFRSRNAVGIGAIQELEIGMLTRALARWSKISNIHVLGGVGVKKRLPIISFLVSLGEKFLHHNFVAALLNDLFGIQCRGGCMCESKIDQTNTPLASILTPNIPP